VGERDREIFELVEPGVASQGVDLVDVELAPARRRTIVRLIVHSDAGVTHADCARVTRVASRILDESGAMAGSYVLEVSSPGTERVLKTPREFDLFRGRAVRVHLRDGSEEITGRAAGARGDAVALMREDGELILPWTRVAKARLVMEPAPAGGQES
jgi:ribosome maturation factor RimP